MNENCLWTEIVHDLSDGKWELVRFVPGLGNTKMIAPFVLGYFHLIAIYVNDVIENVFFILAEIYNVNENCE